MGLVIISLDLENEFELKYTALHCPFLVKVPLCTSHYRGNLSVHIANICQSLVRETNPEMSVVVILSDKHHEEQ